ncbi:hypothetical protein CRUP_009151, partial [Coryphaenoides rupestris]
CADSGCYDTARQGRGRVAAAVVVLVVVVVVVVVVVGRGGDESRPGLKPVSPYSGYGGQLRSSVYQPTELALISKGVGNRPPELSYDTIIPRATATATAIAGSPAHSGASSPSLRIEMGDVENGHAHGNSGNGLHKQPQWNAKECYVMPLLQGR